MDRNDANAAGEKQSSRSRIPNCNRRSMTCGQVSKKVAGFCCQIRPGPLLVPMLRMRSSRGCKNEVRAAPRTVVAEGPLESAKRYLAAAEHEQPVPALNHDLLAAKISYGVLERQPKDESARSIYNFAVARVVQDVDRADLEPWRHPVTVVTDEGRYTLVSPKPADADHDPSRYDLFPTDTLKIGGKFFKTVLDCEWPWRADCSGRALRKSALSSAIQTAAFTRRSPRSFASPAGKRAWSSWIH